MLLQAAMGLPILLYDIARNIFLVSTPLLTIIFVFNEVKKFKKETGFVPGGNRLLRLIFLSFSYSLVIVVAAVIVISLLTMLLFHSTD